MRKTAMPIGDNADGQRHQGNPVQLASPIFPEEIPGSTVLVVVLQRNQAIEYLENFSTHLADLACRDDENEVIASDVPDKAAGAKEPLYYVVQNSRKDVNDPIAL